MALHRAGDVEAASRRYEQALQLDPTLSDGHHLLGLAVHSQGRSHEATRHIERAIALSPAVGFYRTNLGRICADTERHAEAVDALVAALQVLLPEAEASGTLTSGVGAQELALAMRSLNELAGTGQANASALAVSLYEQRGGDGWAYPSVPAVPASLEAEPLGADFFRRGSASLLTRVLQHSAVEEAFPYQAEVLAEAARALHAMQRSRAAIGAAFAAAVLHRDKAERWLNLGSIASQAALGPAERAMSAEREHRKRRTTSSSTSTPDHERWFQAADFAGAAFVRGVTLQNRDQFAEAEAEAAAVEDRRVPRPPERRVVVIYCNEYGQSWWKPWGWKARAGGRGLGGSEEAVIFLSRQLADRGFFVEVYARPPEGERGEEPGGNVVWYHHNRYDASPAAAPDVFVAWRYAVSLAVGQHAGLRYLWLQDIGAAISAQLTPARVASLDGVLALSEFHVSLLPLAAQAKAVVTPNALAPKLFADGDNARLRFIYASNPARGLWQTLEVWPRIHAALGDDAELYVYYGFTPAVMKWGRQTMGDEFPAWLATLKRRLELPGVRYVGLVNHTTLAAAYAASGFTLYPTSFPETGCVAIMKAQALGAVPITSRHLESTLPEMCGEFDLGPPARPGRIADDPAWLREWADAVVAAASADEQAAEAVAAHRTRMIESARERFTWKRVAALWDARFTLDRDRRRDGDGAGNGQRQQQRSSYFAEISVASSAEE